MIPKLLHFIWIGDESRRPDAELDSYPWRNRRHIADMCAVGAQHWAGAADLMRYEILAAQGGIYIDADVRCVAPLEDWLLAPREFAVWESEVMRPGLIANTALGAVPDSALMLQLVESLAMMESVTHADPWRVTGPLFLTAEVHRLRYPLTVYPSHYFLPEHYTGLQYQGTGHVFGRHHWGTTTAIDHQHERPANELEPWDTWRGPTPPPPPPRYRRALGKVARTIRRVR